MPLNVRSDYPALPVGWRRELALRPGWHWLGDPHFALALVAGIVFWLALAALGKAGPLHGWAVLAVLVLLQPLLEELLFRGLIQGKLLTQTWGKRQFAGFTLANLATSLLFTALHFASHPPLWAAGVLLPSLLFGYFRDRHDSIYPAIALHVFYNAGYFLLPLFYVHI
jgi:hypothetical protein